ncbi:MAG: hypothetical protein CW341_12410, partial [Bacteroidetes bacterium]|nr:hypothetical protein [Bacteroidota bacterium]
MLAVLFLPFALQAQVSLPISMDFEDASSMSQWTLINCESSTGRTTNQAHESTACFGFHWTTSPSQFLISPEFGAASGTEEISFWYKTNSDFYAESFEVGFSSTTNDTTAFTWSTAVNIPTTISWTEYTAPIPAGTKYVAIKSTAYDAYYLYIDDIYIGDAPSCFKVSNVTIDAAQTTSNSLTLTWTDASNSNATYNIYNMSDNTLVASNINDTTYTIDNLSPNTLYTFGIETDCGGGDLSAGYASVSGRTACDNIYSTSLPYTENFNTYGTGSASNFPICWHRGYTTSSAYPYISSTGGGSLYFYGSPGTYSYATTEALDNSISLNNFMLSFKLYKGSAAYNIKVGVMEDYEDAST